VPSAVFEASIPGVKSFTVGARVACIGVKFLEYSLAGIVCGFLGQGMANSLMLLKWVAAAGSWGLEQRALAGAGGGWRQPRCAQPGPALSPPPARPAPTA
jgi:hypothetical protein